MLQGTAETKVSNTGGNFFLLLFKYSHHAPCILHFLSIILQAKRNEPSVRNDLAETNGRNGGGDR